MNENQQSFMRSANYDAIASRYDRRYALHEYAGVRDTLLNFIASAPADASILEVGCGTGHWLSAVADRAPDSAASARWLAGIEPSAGMIGRAAAAAPAAHLVRAVAEQLPWADATFDRVYCVNALHHFDDRRRFFAEARRVLRPGGGVLTIGKDPHADRDAWWVYDYFPETAAIDRERFARVRTLRGELTTAGFDWAESFECDEIVASLDAGEALATGIVDRAYTSQLTVLTDDEFEAGAARIRAANEAAGGALQLATDFYLFATTGWIAGAAVSREC
jgi:ubiquinone/menaquinone biosynthesis C-methylase UbiE